MSGMNVLQACGLWEGFFFIIQLLIHCQTVRREKYYTGKNSLEPNGWAVAAMNGAIVEWIADTDQASRAACEWSKGGAKKWFEDTITLCSICAKWNGGFL